MSQVSWHLSGGVRSLRRLSEMLLEAAHTCGVQARLSGDASQIGVLLDQTNCWIGLTFDEPEVLVFRAYNREAKLDLQSEEVHFFARTRDNQVRALQQFLATSLNRVGRLELP